MSCLLTSGYALGCRDSLGGVKRVYIGNFSSGATYTFDSNETIVGFGGATVSYFTFEQEIETGEFNQTGAYSIENGTVFFDQQLSLMFHKNDSTLRNQLLVLSQANMSVIVEDQRGEYWLMGIENGVRAINGAMNTGRLYGDMNGVTITLQGKEKEPTHRISATASGFPV